MRGPHICNPLQCLSCTLSEASGKASLVENKTRCPIKIEMLDPSEDAQRFRKISILVNRSLIFGAIFFSFVFFFFLFFRFFFFFLFSFCENAKREKEDGKVSLQIIMS